MSVRQAATREHIGGNLDRHRRIANFVRHQRHEPGLAMLCRLSADTGARNVAIVHRVGRLRGYSATLARLAGICCHAVAA